MNATSERIELHVTLKPLDLFWLHLSSSSGAGLGFYVKRFLTSAVFLLLAFLTDELSLFGTESRVILPYLFAGLAVFLLLLWPYLAAASKVRQLVGASGAARVVFGEQGVDVIGLGFQQEIQGARQTSSLILLFNKKEPVIVLPKRCIVGEGLSIALRELLTRRVTRRTTQQARTSK